MAASLTHITVKINALGEVDRDRELERLLDENARLREAITIADLQIGDGHIENARRTLHAAMG